jgi:hypothetical protein
MKTFIVWSPFLHRPGVNGFPALENKSVALELLGRSLYAAMHRPLP